VDLHKILVEIVSVLVVLGIMVVVHEFGHFVAAKLFGVRVEQFSVGFPPRLFGIKIGETDYCISAVPLGGYVKMTGETMPGENMSLGADGEAIAAAARDPKALTSKPRWQRMVIGVAGPFANFVLALGLMTAYYTLHNEVPDFVSQPVVLDWVVPGSAAANAGLQPGDHILAFDGQENPSWQTVYQRSGLNLNHSVSVLVGRGSQQLTLTLPLNDDTRGKDFSLDKIGIIPVWQPGPLRVAAVSAKFPAANAGVQPDDQFLSIDGHELHSTASIISYLQSRKGAPVSIVVRHLPKNGPAVTTTATVTPVLMDVPKEGKAWRIGFQGALPPSHVEQLPFGQAVEASIKFNRENSLLILEVIQRLLSRRMSVDSLSGPVAISKETGRAWESQDAGAMIQLMTIISLNLGVLNLLPFPILDGGMIFFLLIESVIRRDVNMVIKERVYQVAFVVLIAFFGYIMYNDFTK
jgi:regulator of sigma E protease